MTLVTTSRRSTPESRSIARCLAFALECKYIPRGKRGLREISTQDSSFFTISEDNKKLQLNLYKEDTCILSRTIISYQFLTRTEALIRAIITSDLSLFEHLKGTAHVIYEEAEERMIRCDGPQKHQIYLIIRGAEESPIR